MVSENASFDDMDLQNITSKTVQVIQSAGPTGVPDVGAGLAAEAQDTVREQSASAGGALRVGVHDLTQRYAANTDLLAQMNESYNSNRFINRALTSEQARVGDLASRAKRDVYKVHQQSQHNNYAVEYYGFLGRVMVLTTFATVLVLMPIAALRAHSLGTSAAVGLVTLVLAVYAVAMVIAFRNVGSRRETAWNQYYFKAGGLQAKATGQSQQPGCSL
jgi:ABC-type multidrug transport system fused ATPase/permease subunit